MGIMMSSSRQHDGYVRAPVINMVRLACIMCCLSPARIMCTIGMLLLAHDTVGGFVSNNTALPC